MMTRNKMSRWSSLFVWMAVIFFGASLVVGAKNWDAEDWDDDLVKDTKEELDCTDPTNPVKSAKFAQRALVLSQVKSGGVNLPEPLRFTANNSFTLEMWFCPVGDTVSGELFTYTDGSAGYKLYVEDKVVKVDFAGSTSTANYTLTDITDDVTKPEWTHIAIVWSRPSGTLSLLIDGAVVGTDTITPLPSGSTKPEDVTAVLGSDFDAGYIDEVRFWAEARTESQVTGQMYRLAPIGIPELVANYRFDDGGLSIEDFAHLPDIKAAIELHKANPADPKIDEMFQYRLLAADNGVKTASLYRTTDNSNPDQIDLSGTNVETYVAGHALWVTALGAAVPEGDAYLNNTADDDGDGLNDDGSSLDGSKLYAICRKGGATKVLTSIVDPDKEFKVYDSEGNSLWILSKDPETPPPSSSLIAIGDLGLTRMGLADKLKSPETAFHDSRDNDSDGVIDDTAIAVTLKAPPAINDTDDDGISDHDENIGATQFHEITDDNDPYSPLINRALDLTSPGESEMEK